MPDIIGDEILLVGAGAMASAYAQVLLALRRPFLAVGRGDESAMRFREETGVEAVTGGIKRFFGTGRKEWHWAIVAVDETVSAETVLFLLHRGVKAVLVEKPAALNLADIRRIAGSAKTEKADVYVAYNRRFYASTRKAREIIEADGGVKSFCFEFTEWSHRIEALDKPARVKRNWLLANSTHVIDLAFFVAGFPGKIFPLKSGKLPWHQAGSIFVGAGISRSGAPFSYHSNWEGPGRWGAEFVTSRHRLFFRPLEQLQVQNKGEISIEPFPLDDSLDIRFKPGIYRQTEAFLSGDPGKTMVSARDQADHFRIYSRILRGK